MDRRDGVSNVCSFIPTFYVEDCMTRIRKSAFWALGIGLLGVLPLEAQPGGGGRGGGGGGGGF